MCCFQFNDYDSSCTFLQGLGGGGLLPLGQSIMLESFPPQDRPKSMAIFGIAVIFAPLIGPVLGGWITETGLGRGYIS